MDPMEQLGMSAVTGAVASVIGVDPFGGTDELKQRKPNFTEAEKFFLVRQYAEYKGILADRSSDSNINRMKQQVWQLITDELNRRNPAVQRSTTEIRKKWQNLVTTARKEVKDADQRGLASSQLPFLWRKVAELCGGQYDGEEDPSLCGPAEEQLPERTQSTSSPFPFPSPSGSIGAELIKDEPAWSNVTSASAGP